MLKRDRGEDIVVCEQTLVALCRKIQWFSCERSHSSMFAEL